MEADKTSRSRETDAGRARAVEPALVRARRETVGVTLTFMMHECNR